MSTEMDFNFIPKRNRNTVQKHPRAVLVYCNPGIFETQYSELNTETAFAEGYHTR
ncbi:hypothetical protein J6590_095363 [Homalodisca vitripennis]|nr:hypothetical protein J6590_095363 [Homalodisca vitripennis]